MTLHDGASFTDVNRPEYLDLDVKVSSINFPNFRTLLGSAVTIAKERVIEDSWDLDINSVCKFDTHVDFLTFIPVDSSYEFNHSVDREFGE